MEVTFKFHKAEEELPKESGRYLVATNSVFLSDIQYSAKHKKFNCYDYEKNPEKAFKVALWAEIPEELKTEADKWWEKHKEEDL